MIPKAPSLFQIEEEGMVASAPTPAASGGELVGLRLIIQPSSSPRQPAGCPQEVNGRGPDGDGERVQVPRDVCGVGIPEALLLLPQEAGRRHGRLRIQVKILVYIVVVQSFYASISL
jgi:hypothetical protein